LGKQETADLFREAEIANRSKTIRVGGEDVDVIKAVKKGVTGALSYTAIGRLLKKLGATSAAPFGK